MACLQSPCERVEPAQVLVALRRRGARRRWRPGRPRPRPGAGRTAPGPRRAGSGRPPRPGASWVALRSRSTADTVSPLASSALPSQNWASARLASRLVAWSSVLHRLVGLLLLEQQRRRAARGRARPAGRAPGRSRAPCGPAPARRRARGPSPGASCASADPGSAATAFSARARAPGTSPRASSEPGRSGQRRRAPRDRRRAPSRTPPRPRRCPRGRRRAQPWAASTSASAGPFSAAILSCASALLEVPLGRRRAGPARAAPASRREPWRRRSRRPSGPRRPSRPAAPSSPSRGAGRGRPGDRDMRAVEGGRRVGGLPGGELRPGRAARRPRRSGWPRGWPPARRWPWRARPGAAARRPSATRASVAPAQSCAAFASSASAPSASPRRASAPGEEHARPGPLRGSEPVDALLLEQRARAPPPRRGRPPSRGAPPGRAPRQRSPGPSRPPASRMARAAVSSPFRTAIAARSRADRVEPGEARVEPVEEGRGRGPGRRAPARRGRAGRASPDRASRGRTFSSAAAGLPRVVAGGEGRGEPRLLRRPGGRVVGDERRGELPRPGRLPVRAAGGERRGGAGEQPDALRIVRRGAPAPAAASCSAFWSDGKASWASSCRPSAASFATAGSLLDRKAFQKKGPWRVKAPAIPTPATRTSRTPAATPSPTIRLRDRARPATFSRNPPCMRGWKGAGTDPVPDGARGLRHQRRLVHPLDRRLEGPAAPMAIHSSPSPAETSSLPFSSPLPSISTISRSEKGPKTRPDGRRTR